MSSTSGESIITIESESNPNRQKGELLNDNSVDIDHLGRVIYAKALAQQIQIVKSPVAVGIFSQWGTGKSFLLTHVQSILKFKNKRNEKQTRLKALIPLILFALSILGSIIAIFASIYFVITFLALLLFFFNFFLTINDNNFLKTFHFLKVIFYALFTQLLIRVPEFPYIPTTVPHKCTFKQDKSLHASTKNKVSNCEKRKLIPPGDKRPTTNNTNTDKKSRRFIYVNFNAWQYEGCDTLWAGIVTTMAEKIEEEFGVLTTRIFRSLSLDLKEKPNVGDQYMCIEIKEDQENNEQNLKDFLMKYGNVLACQKFEDWIKDKTLCMEVKNKEQSFVVQFEHQDELKQAYHELPYDKNCRVTVLENLKSGSENNKKKFCNHLRKYPRTCYSLVLISLIFSFAVSLERGICKTIQDPSLNESSNVVVGVLALLPAGVSFLYGIIKFIYALLNSYQSTINKALQGAKKDFSAELGFMKKIKEEVESITNLIQAVEMSHNLEYKVIITVDDLDRVPLSKVKSVLEAVSILLSDRNSPFICLIAIDPRIASTCFTVTSKQKSPSTINGHEYLKKIINLPFCLPEIDDEAKCSFVRDLIDEADVTRDDSNKAEGSSTSQNTSSANSINDEEEQGEDDEFELKDFLEECRKQMHTNKCLVKILNGNPRDLKRIFNVISMTASLIDIIQKRNNPQQETDNFTNIETPTAEELSCWIELTEQWPFQMSYILIMMNIVDEREAKPKEFPNKTPLFDIYDEIKTEEHNTFHSQHNLLQLDYDDLILVNFLGNNKNLLTKGFANRMWKYTTNLDSSIMKSISLERDQRLHIGTKGKQNANQIKSTKQT